MGDEKLTLELRDEDGELVAVWKIDDTVDVNQLAGAVAGILEVHAAQVAERARPS